MTGKNYRWAIAYKFAALQAITKIHAIAIGVGRTGVLTPVALLDPVQVAGSTISRATLHNEDEVHRKDIREGDTVIIEKGGDVIPKVVSVILEKRPAHSKPWKMPTKCPVCGTNVVRTEGEVAVRCPNKVGCPAQGLKRLTFFVSKSAMDIDNLGEKVVEQLVEHGFVSQPSDIYLLTEKELSQLRNFKEKSIQNLLASIEKSKDVTLGKFIMALNIPHVGAETAHLLADHTESLEKLALMTESDLMEIHGIGQVMAQAVVDYFGDHENKIEILRLLERGVTPTHKKVKGVEGHPFSGKTFVLTGTLSNYSREQAAQLIQERGGKVSSSVSKETDFLLLGEDPGSKYDKAKKLGVTILEEQDFVKLI